MITKPTVFVFGAGVSIPYGYPSGPKLVELICTATQKPLDEFQSSITPRNKDLVSIRLTLSKKFGDLKVVEFGNELFYSQQPSIDAFLEHRPKDFMEIGKTAIVLTLLRKEIEANLHSFENRYKGIYHYLFSKLRTGFDTFQNNRVGIVTFNYDRSFEQFLYTALKHTYGLNDEKCFDTISMIPIVHVHGSLGPLPWQANENVVFGGKYIRVNEITATTEFDQTMTNFATKQIIIVSEGQDTSPAFDKAYDMLSRAERIHFLGFGYNDVSLRRLRINLLTPEVMDGTAFGFGDAEVEEIVRTTRIQLPDNKSDAIEFLKKYIHF